MSPTEALEIIREALDKWADTFPEGNVNPVAHAFSALSVLEASVLPELPEDWEIIECKLYVHCKYDRYQDKSITANNCRAAMLAAIGGINEN